jgi:hypothetical protein
VKPCIPTPALKIKRKEKKERMWAGGQCFSGDYFRKESEVSLSFSI